MTPDEHAAAAIRIGADVEDTGAALAIAHAVLALRPAPALGPSVRFWVDNEGDQWIEAPDGAMYLRQHDNRGTTAEEYGPLREVMPS